MHFTWDALDRLVAVDQSDGRRTEFIYDGYSRRSRIVEKTNGVVSGETRLIWAGLRTLLEERASDNSTIARFFGNGFIDKDGTAWYYTRDHLGSVRVVTDTSGNIGAAYEYSAYGERTQIAGSLNLSLSFTGHWEHTPTGMVLAPF